MSKTMKPLFDKVLIKRETLKDKLKTTLVIPDTVAQRNAPSTGVILAVGPDTEQVEVGQRVIFGIHAGSWLKDDDDNDVFICLDTDVLCVLPPRKKQIVKPPGGFVLTKGAA